MFAKVLLRETETKDAPSVNLNLNVRGLGQSDTLAINEQCAELICSGKEIFKFGLGQSPFPVPEQVVGALRANAHQKDYLPVKGLYALREAVADYHRRKDGVQRSPDDVLIGPGSKELMFLMQLVYYGDLVIPTPSWVSYAPQAQIIGRQVRWIPTTSANYWLVTPDELEHVCESDPSRPRLLIINYPNNPTGYTYSREHLKELAEVAHKYRILLLSDEIYGEIHYEGKHVSIAQFYPEGTIISSGLSKWCGAGGWRLGTFIFPRTLRWLLDSMAAVASETFTSTSAPIQYAAVRAFQGGPEIETYLTRCRIVLRALARHCTQKLKDVGIKIYEPRGAFYLFPSFSPLQEKLEAHGITTSPQLCKRILEETGVAGLPGTSFGRPEHKLTLRLAYVDFDGEKVLRAMEKMGNGFEPDEAFLRTYCAKVTTGIDRLCDWVRSL